MKFKVDLFRISIPICVVIGIVGIFWPDALAGGVAALTGAVFGAVDWFFLLTSTLFLVLCGWLALGRHGRLKLGGEDAVPEFSTTAWLSMLFAAGMGCGLLFWSVAEPIMHFDHPPVGEGRTAEAARHALVLANFHWGAHAWAIYGIGALILAYFGFRKGQPYLPGAPIRAGFKGRWVEPVAKASDFIAVLAVACGVAGSIAMGVLQLEAGFKTVLGVGDNPFWVRGSILLVLFVCYTLSAATSLDKGIKILSQTNMFLAIVLMLFVLFAGPTAEIMGVFVTSIGDYLTAIPTLSFNTYPNTDAESWFHGWTIIYLVWWVAWAPFVGVFIARISSGRTIREFVLGVIFTPTLFSMLWFAIFGGFGIHEELTNGGISEMVAEDVTVALFSAFERLPMTEALGVLTLFLVFVFLVTSVDSATYVLGMLTTQGTLNPPVRRKLVWGITLGVMGAALLVSGRIDVVRGVSISGAIPFVLVLGLQLVALLRALRTEGDDS
jgi:glycine betaine transporter